MDKEDFDDFIEEKCEHIINYSNEDGSINENLGKEIDDFIDNMPRLYEKCSNDNEWTEKRWTFISDITGPFAKWATSQSSYACPDNLEKIIKYLHECLKRDVKWELAGMAELSLCDISKLLYDILYDTGISYFDDWNKSKKDWEKDGKYDYFSEAEEKDPDYGFIDLDALLNNVCLDIRTERRESKKFHEEFEEKWKKENEEK